MNNVKDIKIRRFKILLVLIIVTIFIIFCFSLFRNDNDSDDNNEYNNENEENVNLLYKEMITDSNESDDYVIADSLANGMGISDFKDILNRKAVYIDNNKKYEEMSYNFENKLSYEEIEEYLYNMAASDIVVLENIGKSVDDRIIYGIEVGKGKSTLFIDGNIHAAEVGGSLFILKLLNDLVSDYESGDEEVIELLNKYRIVAVPSMNPDGYEYINYGIESIRNKDLWIYQNKDKVDKDDSKFNANGVDLNRNFPTQNGALLFEGKKLISSVSDGKTTSIYKYYSGESLGSEPETRAFMYYFIKHYKSIHTYVNIHSQGRVLYAGKPNLSDEFNSLCKKTASKISDITNYKAHGLSAEEVGEGNDGSVTDFAAELANGFKFNADTGRLSSDKHIDNSAELKYNYSVITLETLDRYTTNPKYFKDEWVYRNFEELFLTLLKNEY